MGLLNDIQNDALSQSTPVTVLLRKVMVLGAELDSNIVEDWVRYELNGYPDDADVPEYRHLDMQFKVSGQNIAWRVTGHNVPSALVGAALQKDDIDIFLCRQAVGTINEDVIKKAEGQLHVNMDNQALLLHGKIFQQGFTISRFWGEVSGSQVLGILEAIRNRVLEFVLALKKKYPEFDTVDVTKQPVVEQTVSQIFHTSVYGGNANVVGSAKDSTLNFSVNQGNITDLRQQLTAQGVEDGDIKEIELAVLDEPQVGPDKKFGPKVTHWIGKMVGKAASGVWGVGLEVGSAVVQKALLGYYGLDG